LHDYVDALTESDYTAENWQEIEQLLIEAEAEINGYTDIEQVNNNEIFFTRIDSVETIEQTAARELAEAKQRAVLQIDAIEDKYNAYNYGE